MKGRADRKVIATIAAAIVSVVAALFFFVTLPPPVDRSLHANIGAALADEAGRLVRPGGKITVICRDMETFPQPAMDVLLKSFKSHTKGAEVITLPVQVDPLRPANVPPGDFFELLRKSKAEDVIVSFLGPPMLSADQIVMAGGVRPRIVAFCAGPVAANLDLRSLFDVGLLHAAVVGRSFTKTTADTSRIIPHDFASLYRTYQSNELAALPRAAAIAGSQL
jgi:hypothetical protein